MKRAPELGKYRPGPTLSLFIIQWLFGKVIVLIKMGKCLITCVLGHEGYEIISYTVKLCKFICHDLPVLSLQTPFRCEWQFFSQPVLLSCWCYLVSCWCYLVWFFIFSLPVYDAFGDSFFLPHLPFVYFAGRLALQSVWTWRFLQFLNTWSSRFI